MTGILPLSGRRAAAGPARPVELTVVVRDDVRPWRVPPIEDFLYGEWERAAYEAGELPQRRHEPGPRAAPDDGPRRPARGLRPATRRAARSRPADDLVRAVVAGIPGLLADLDDDTRNVLLTLARILVTVETGGSSPRTRPRSASCPGSAPGSGSVLERARDAYHGPDYGSFEDLGASVRPCADALIRAIDEAVSSRPA